MKAHTVCSIRRTAPDRTDEQRDERGDAPAMSNGTGEDTSISGGHLVAKSLKAEGVDVVFTLCGGHIIDIYDGCADEGIDIIDVRHEQVDAHTAVCGGRRVAEARKAEGVDVGITLCGGHIIDIYGGCADESTDLIDVRHEQVAAHAAGGYARITGEPGCAVVTAGPGTTNAVTGIANAYRAESPMLLIGGQGALSQHKMGSLQDLPHVDMITPISKFAATVPHTERVADLVSMAFR